MNMALGSAARYATVSPRAVRESARCCTNVTITRGIDHHAIGSAIAVQIGIDSTLRSYVLARLVGIYGRNFPVTDDVLQPPIAVLQIRKVVNHLQNDAVSIIE